MFQSAESRDNQWVREHYRFLLRSAWALTGSRAARTKALAVARVSFGNTANAPG